MQHGSKPPTLKTIAEMTGLSLSTVSLSLRDGSRLKKETREKVAKAAAEIGYVPNRAGVRLRTGQTNVLTLVLSPQRNAVDYTRRLIEGIGAYLRDTVHHLNVTPELDTDDPTTAIRYILNNRTSDGVILTHTTPRDPRVQMLMEADFPFICHGRTEFYTPHAYHDFHAEKFVDVAVERLLVRGRKKFLLLAEDNGTMNFANTVSGFNAATAKHGIAGKIETDPRKLSTTTDARVYGKELAQSGEMYDAIVCNNELSSMAVIAGLCDGGLELGREFELICKQTTEILPTLHPHMDTVAEDWFETGQELARMLIERVKGGDVNNLQMLQPPIPSWKMS